MEYQNDHKAVNKSQKSQLMGVFLLLQLQSANERIFRAQIKFPKIASLKRQHTIVSLILDVAQSHTTSRTKLLNSLWTTIFSWKYSTYMYMYIVFRSLTITKKIILPNNWSRRQCVLTFDGFTELIWYVFDVIHGVRLVVVVFLQTEQ